MHVLGEITLNISMLCYFIWFCPQLFLNLKKQNLHGLSFIMHLLLFIGYFSDLIYGFGRHMEWQYRAVTLAGLASLLVQHLQFWFYHFKNTKIKHNKNIYICSTVILSAAFLSVILNLHYYSESKLFYDCFGTLSGICWTIYLFPQIIKNYFNKSTRSLSVGFIGLGIIINLCDWSAAILLGWDYPSLIFTPITILKKIIILWQFWKYTSNESSGGAAIQLRHTAI